MSIATLKKKTGVKYNNMSVSQPLFSLNGTRRSQGFIGQTSLSRSSSRTLIRNGGYRNYGGCCGTFKIGEIVQTSVKTTENNSVVKGSTLNTLGLLHVNKYTCLWRPAPYTTVKMDSNRNINSQSDYIKNVEKNTLAEASTCTKKNTDPCSTLQSNTNCNLVNAVYSAKVSVNPAGIVVSKSFFTSTSLVQAPSDNLWYDAITSLLLSIPGIGKVTINQLNNQITIETSKNNTILQKQEIVVDLVIVYDIMCSS